MRALATIVAMVLAAAPATADVRPAGGAGKARQGLQVSISAAETYTADQPVEVTLTVENTTQAPIDVRQSLEAFSVKVAWPAPSAEGCTHRYTGTRSRTLRFVQTNRGQLAPTATPLAPGAKLTYAVDLAGWATGGGNTGGALGAGWFKATAVFGKATSKPVGFQVEGTPGKRRCAKNPGWRFWGT